MTEEFFDFLTTVLRGIEDELDRVMWNNTQEDYLSPFGNTGNSYKNDVFEVRAYDWANENTWNFKYKDIEISWYKYLGRDMDINRKMSLEEIYQMYQDCVESVRKEDI